MSGFQVGAGDQQQDAKLTETERKLVARLFSDPTYFPIEFRIWLKNYIENAGINVTASQIRGGTRTRTGMPPGLFISCGSVAAVPPDALQCDGSAKSRTVYAQLFAKIGTTWGAGDGTTTFNVPDLADRAIYGAGVTITPGGTDGQAAANRKGPTHQHGTHNHGLAKSGTVTKAGGINGTPALGLSTSGPGGTAQIGWPTGTGDRVPQTISDGIGISDTIGYTINPAQVGPPGSLQDAGNWAGVIYAITTGQTG